MNGAQLHLLLNHVPVLGVAFAAALTLSGIARDSDELRKVGLWAFILAALTALPAYFSGEGAEDIIEHLTGVTDEIIHAHEEAAEKALAGALLLGTVAAGALFASFKNHGLLRKAALVALLLSLPVLASLAYTAHLGGLVRHTELRTTE